MYTTYEKVVFDFSDTMPSARRGMLGVPMVKMIDEWNGIRFGLNIGERVPFIHIPIEMTKNAEGVLVGTMSYS